MTDANPAALRVLVVAGREPWPLNGGGRLRLYHFLKWLARDATVTLALPGPAQYAEHLPEAIRVVDMTATSVKTLSTLPTRTTAVSRRMRQHFGGEPAVDHWLAAHARPERFDVALLYGAVTGQYIDALRIPAVWDAVDELVLYTVRDATQRGLPHWPAAVRAGAQYAVFERHVAQRAQATVFASLVDASYARRWAGGARIETITNGVDFDYFRGPVQESEPGVIAFVGSLAFPPNIEGIVWFATRVWPQVRGNDSGRRLLVVGREPVEAVRDLARQPGIEVHADVLDVRPYVSRAAVVVVPTHLGGGVKNKVLEACAMSRAVVASPRALGGLSARRGTDVLCAGGESAWVRQVRRLLEQPALATTIGEHGRRWVRQAHRWPVLARRLHALLASAVTSGQSVSVAQVPQRVGDREALCR
jgi:polysaccharide biosynthesis protein PslH